MRNKFLKAQGTNESHSLEITSKTLGDHLEGEYRWKREGSILGPLLCFRAGKMRRKNTKCQKRTASKIGREPWGLVSWSANIHTHICLTLKMALNC